MYRKSNHLNWNIGSTVIHEHIKSCQIFVNDNYLNYNFSKILVNRAQTGKVPNVVITSSFEER